MPKPEDQINRVARKKQIIRSRDFPGISNPTVYFNRLVANGHLVRLGRGLYARPDRRMSVYHSLVEACERIPSGVICLLSALSFHGFTTQNPAEVWIALHSNFTPSRGGVRLRPIRMSGPAFNHAIERHNIEGIEIRVFPAAKTVADCFKFRNKVGLDVALEALREGWRLKKFTMDELWAAAAACRIQKIIRPYMETIVAL